MHLKYRQEVAQAELQRFISALLRGVFMIKCMFRIDCFSPVLDEDTTAPEQKVLNTLQQRVSFVCRTDPAVSGDSDVGAQWRDGSSHRQDP